MSDMQATTKEAKTCGEIRGRVGKGPKLRGLGRLLNDVGDFLGCVPGREVLPLPLFVFNRQEENLCAGFWVVDGRLNNELLAIGLKCLEEPESII